MLDVPVFATPIRILLVNTRPEDDSCRYKKVVSSTQFRRNNVLASSLTFMLLVSSTFLAVLTSSSLAGMPSDSDMFLLKGTPARNTRVNMMYRSPQRSYVVLDGQWEFQIDADEQGIEEGWYKGQAKYADKATVPAAIEAQDLGHHRGRKFRTKVSGRVWYRKTVNVPSDWSQRKIHLNIGGAVPNVWVWVNGRLVGARHCDLTAFSFDVTSFITPGQANTIVISLDKRVKRSFRIDWWMMDWAGLWRSVELEAVAVVNIEDVFVVPDTETSTAKMNVTVVNQSDRPQQLNIEAVVMPWKVKPLVTGGKGDAKFTVGPGERKVITVSVSIANMQLWRLNDPFLYKFEVTLRDDTEKIDSWIDRFGMRSLRVKGNRLTLNNRPLLVRGAMYQFDFPETICPPANRVAWLDRVREFKSIGSNYIRLVGSIAPPELCDVADEEGILLSCAVCDSSCEGPEDVTDPAENYRIREVLRQRWWTEAVLALRNHPSLFMYVLSNEGKMSDRPELPELYRFVKSLDSTRFIVNCDGPGPGEDPNSMEAYEETDFWIPLSWPTAEQQTRKPFMVHEYVNAPTLPDLETLAQMTGPLRSPWLEAFNHYATAAQVTEKYPLFLKASHHLQRQWVKLSLEALRMRPNCDGYMACASRDAEGITYAGLIGRFGKPKAVAAKDLRRWQADTVLLCSLVSPANKTYFSGDTIHARFAVSHFSPQVIRNGHVHWQLVRDDNAKVLAEGKLSGFSLEAHQLTKVGNVGIVAPDLAASAALTLRAKLESETLSVQNEWPLWIFPSNRWLRDTRGKVITQINLPSRVTQRYPFLSRQEKQEKPPGDAGLLITDHLSGNLDFLEAGGRVLLYKPSKELPSLMGQAWPGWWRPRHNNQGIVLEKHPALKRFPSGQFGGMQFNALLGGGLDMHKLKVFSIEPDRAARGYDQLQQGVGIELSELPFEVDPIAHGVTWNLPTSPHPPKQVVHLAYLAETNVGRGKLLISGFDLTGPTPEQQWLFDGLLRYCSGDTFKPKAKADPKIVRHLLNML